MGGAVLVVRRARGGDAAARLRLVRDSLAETHLDAFLYFFFQELTLQAVVLCGAVLFIFCGVSVWGCVLLLPAAAVLVWLAVYAHNASVANNAIARVRGEEAGWVVELRGPLLLAASAAPRLLLEHEAHHYTDSEPQHREIVGTVSVSPRRGDPAAGWVSLLCVRARWRRRGCGGALAAAARRWAAAAGRAALHAATSQLQPAARTLLHKHGWECVGTYQRALLGDALWLPMAQLALDLPHA